MFSSGLLKPSLKFFGNVSVSSGSLQPHTHSPVVALFLLSALLLSPLCSLLLLLSAFLPGPFSVLLPSSLLLLLPILHPPVSSTSLSSGLHLSVLYSSSAPRQWNMGPDRNAQLDDFSLFLPFAYRVAVLLVAGMSGSRLGKTLSSY